MTEFPDFKRMLSERLKKTDGGTHAPKPNKRSAQPILERFKGGTEPLYNIYKRSLPVGIDKVVGWGFTMEQAKKHIAKHHKVRSLPLERHQDTRTVIYHDIILQDGGEHSIYENNCQISTVLDKKGEILC